MENPQPIVDRRRSKHPDGPFRKRFPRCVTAHVTEAEYAEIMEIVDARAAVSPGFNMRMFLLEMLRAHQRNGAYKK